MLCLICTHPYRDRSGGPDAKRGPLKFLTLVRGGGLKKIYKFSSKNWVCFSIGLTRNFHGKKGVLKYFEVWRGALKKFCNQFFLHLLPLTNVCERSLRAVNRVNRYQTIHMFMWRIKCLWGNCTSNNNWACFVCYLKIMNTFLRKIGKCTKHAQFWFGVQFFLDMII